MQYAYNPMAGLMPETGLMVDVAEGLLPEVGLAIVDDLVDGFATVADIWNGGDAKRARAEQAKAKAAEIALQTQREAQAFQLQAFQAQQAAQQSNAAQLAMRPAAGGFWTQETMGLPHWAIAGISLATIGGLYLALKA